MVQHFQNCLLWSDIVQKGLKWFQKVQNYPKGSKHFKMVQKLSKMVQYSQNSIKIGSQNEGGV